MIGRLFLDAGKCMFCGTCELACSVRNSGGRNLREYLESENIKPGSIWVIRSGQGIEAGLCRSCRYPQCVESCITAAMSLDQGRVNYDKDKCAACWSCVMGCPFGAVKADPSGKAVIRCDGCGERAVPACVESCPTGALMLESPDKYSRARRKSFSTAALKPFGAL
ncbi:MAG: 4Fe-4S dicluster domain-containing protein [Desulfocucumaceae bacterium]